MSKIYANTKIVGAFTWQGGEDELHEMVKFGELEVCHENQQNYLH